MLTILNMYALLYSAAPMLYKERKQKERMKIAFLQRYFRTEKQRTMIQSYTVSSAHIHIAYKERIIISKS